MNFVEELRWRGMIQESSSIYIYCFSQKYDFFLILKKYVLIKQRHPAYTYNVYKTILILKTFSIFAPV